MTGYVNYQSKHLAVLALAWIATREFEVTDG